MEAFELRLWDGRLGRWLTVDPYGQYFLPYLGMGNNPISRIDPDGGHDLEYKDFSAFKKFDFIGSDWGWLTKSQLFNYTKENYGKGLSDPQIENLVGKKFEGAWNRYAISNLSEVNYRSNSTPYYSESRGRNVVPDGLGDFRHVEYPRNQNGFPMFWKRPVVDVNVRGGIWVEVKAKNGNIYNSTSQGQIAGHIDAMGRNPLIKKYGGQLIFVTTSNVSISWSVISASYKVHDELVISHVKAKGRISDGKLEIQYYMNSDVRDDGKSFHNMSFLGDYVKY
ncbi:hypothetical protein NAT51_19275 [Flavobacterium amniphilum]|uniref:hypothetical protein n=1 Tax=Flavobacterium amniphilum TaxID=1834035 RepID=UPI00202A3BB8|nr:hypothetical protein [Flavobacterium amniphilum]MCL9807673.1 hypothetical protein [Flavobacterium amniphilum]